MGFRLPSLRDTPAQLLGRSWHGGIGTRAGLQSGESGKGCQGQRRRCSGDGRCALQVRCGRRARTPRGGVGSFFATRGLRIPTVIVVVGGSPCTSESLLREGRYIGPSPLVAVAFAVAAARLTAQSGCRTRVVAAVGGVVTGADQGMARALSGRAGVRRASTTGAQESRRRAVLSNSRSSRGHRCGFGFAAGLSGCLRRGGASAPRLRHARSDDRRSGISAAPVRIARRGEQLRREVWRAGSATSFNRRSIERMPCLSRIIMSQGVAELFLDVAEINP